MKILIDTDDEKAIAALANAIADKLLPLLADYAADRSKAEAPVSPTKPATAPKAGTKDKPAAKAPDAGKADSKAPVKDDVLAALRDASGPKEADDYAAKKAAALAVLQKHSKSLAELPADKYQTVIDAIKALDSKAAVEADEDF